MHHSLSIFFFYPPPKLTQFSTRRNLTCVYNDIPIRIIMNRSRANRGTLPYELSESPTHPPNSGCYLTAMYTSSAENSVATTSRTSSNPSKKRKVAYAPPPSSYAGFCLPGEGKTRKTRTHPRLTSSVRWREEKGAPHRKVHPMATVSKDIEKEPQSAPGLITTSSWRSGKKLAKQLLRTSGQRKTTKMKTMANQRCPSPGSFVHSLNQTNIEFKSNTDPLSSYQVSSGDRDHGSGRGHTLEETNNSVTMGNCKNGLGGTAPSSASRIDAQAAQLSFDMKKLKEELNMPLQSPSAGGHGSGDRERTAATIRPWREGMRRGSTSAKKAPSSSRKPKFTTGEWMVIYHIAC